ncbi:MAG: HIT domain-containing protein, partial [Nanoarchaeota archaeon]|nr:HIT domain-containing protein [Nanoarchaeota archaeon]
MTEGEISGNQCVFCSIIEGKIGSAKIYEDDIVVCVLDIFPASKGHMLVIPKKH